MWKIITSIFKAIFGSDEKSDPSPATKAPPGPAIDWTKIEEGTVEFYRAAFIQMAQDPGYSSVIKAAANKVLAGKSRYLAVAARTGIPWWVIGLIHYKEASCSFAGVLHNGEKIIGTGKKTTLVPKGRGPFSTWEDAAVDAITLNGSRWNSVRNAKPELGAIFHALERYNGTGYLTGAGKADTTPYLWGMSSVNDDYGIYYADGKFDPKRSSNGSAGIAVILRELMDMGAVTVEIGPLKFSTAPSSPDAGSDEIGAGLVAIAEKNGIPTDPVRKMIELQKKDRPGKNPVNWGMINFGKHSKEERFYLFDRVAGTVLKLHTSHGSGSDANHDGIADKFSNVSGSKCSSLGFYRCAETYIGKHGTSLRLDGMETTNSNARARAVVIHSATYVGPDYVKKNGKCGRSEGCPAIDLAEIKNVISRLQNGSPLYAWK